MQRHDAPKRRFNDYHLALTFQSGAHEGTIYAAVEGSDETYGAQILRAMLGVGGVDIDGVRALLQGEIPDEIQGLGEDEAIEEIVGIDPSDAFDLLLLELAADPRNQKVLTRQVLEEEEDDYEIPVLVLRHLDSPKALHVVSDWEDYLVAVRITQSAATPPDVVQELAQEAADEMDAGV